MQPLIRTVSVDPGLLTPEELLAQHEGGRRRTLEQLIEKSRELHIEKKSCNILCKEKIRWFLDTARLRISYDDIMTIATIFVLFGDWVRILCFSPSADSTFAVLYNLAFFLFMAELILNCWAKSDFSGGIFRVKGYMFNFFFWLDLLCIVSMIPDLGWASSLIGMDSWASGVGAKAGKAGKIGAKTGRVVRMARLVRLVKLYKISSQRKREKKLIEDLGRLVELGHMDQHDIETYLDRMNSSQKQSKVGSELSDIITRRVIIAVLLMLLVVPLLSYSSSAQDNVHATEFLQSININTGVGDESNCPYLESASYQFTDFMQNMFETATSDYKYLLEYKVEPERCNIDNNLDDYDSADFREGELEKVILSLQVGDTEYAVTATYNLKYILKKEALAGIYLTIFVVFMLIMLSTQFTGDAQKLVLAPIESMMEMIDMVARDPLEDFDFSDIARTAEYETKVVQVAIQKITALLRLGFGVAGAEIISTNMAVEGEGSNVLEPMIPGKRIYAIFGFCDIHSFDLCTEKLEDEIMTFVNSVARIVHEEVTRWGGLCNKNLGNAFLMVWRIGDESALQSLSGRRRRKSQLSQLSGNQNSRPTTPTSPSLSSSVRSLTVDLRRIPGLDIMADKALIGFLKVIVEVNRDTQVLGYRNDARLATPSGPFQLRMGFGLHAGWAIEGAVGSLQKVDATYLSPHVNMAARMEAASRQFGVSILMTERFQELMSCEAHAHCRKIDIVTVKGSSVPMPIYTYDTHQDQIFPLLKSPKFSNLNISEILRKQADDYDTLIWESDEDLVQLRCLTTEEFLSTYKSGLNSYLSGDWPKARELLKKSNLIMKEGNGVGDGPSMTLLSYMEELDWKCPYNWKGFRPLTKKS